MTHAPLTTSLKSNPFCTRLVRPGSFPYQFCDPSSFEPKAVDSQSAFVEMVARLHQYRFGLIVGAHGSGKSTLLHSLRPAISKVFNEIEYVQLSAPRSDRFLDRSANASRAANQLYAQQAQLPHGGLLVVDGAEQLWRLDLAWLLRKAKRYGQAVLATSHFPVGSMTILHETKVTSGLVLSLTESLLTEASPGVAKIVRSELAKQDWSTLTNVRDLWFELYDVVQPHLFPPVQVSTQQD